MSPVSDIPPPRPASPEIDPDRPLVSFIMVALGRVEETLASLGTISDQSGFSQEIILLDNGTSPPLVDPVARAFPQVRIIRLEENVGVCRGRNLAARRARGRFLAFINNDCLLAPGWLSRMMETIERSGDIGAVAGAVIMEGREGLVDSLGLGMADNGMCRQVGHGGPLPALDGPRETLSFHGCTFLARAEAMAEAGGFDDTFFIYFDEPDLCLRMWWAGWKVLLEARAVAVHSRENTIGLHSLRKLYFLERNHYWVALKCMPTRQFLLLPWYTLQRFLVGARLVLQRGLKENDPRDFYQALPLGRLLKTILLANFHALRRVPEMLAKRRRIKRKVPPVRIQALLKRHRITLRQALVNQMIMPPWERDHWS